MEDGVEASRVSSDGKVTIPSRIRNILGVAGGDIVEFVIEGDMVTIVRRERKIEAAFGLVKSVRSVSLEEIEQAIQTRNKNGVQQ